MRQTALGTNALRLSLTKLTLAGLLIACVGAAACDGLTKWDSQTSEWNSKTSAANSHKAKALGYTDIEAICYHDTKIVTIRAWPIGYQSMYGAGPYYNKFEESDYWIEGRPWKFFCEK